jgi:hypothetical protein
MAIISFGGYAVLASFVFSILDLDIWSRSKEINSSVAVGESMEILNRSTGYLL